MISFLTVIILVWEMLSDKNFNSLKKINYDSTDIL